MKTSSFNSSIQQKKRKILFKNLLSSIFISTRLKRISGCALLVFVALPLNAEIFLHNAQDALALARAHDKEHDLQEQYLSHGVKLAKMSVGAFLPSFEFSWSESDNVPVDASDHRSKSIGAGITQKLFDGGKAALEYKMQIDKAKLDFYDFKKNYENFESQVVQSYYENVLALEKCSVQSEALKNARNILALAEIQLQQGMIVESEYLETAISASQIEAQLNAYTYEAASAKRNFSSLLALPHGSAITFCKENFSRAKIENAMFLESQDDGERLVRDAIENSVELKKLDMEIDFAKKQHAIQKMVFLPSLSVNAGIEFSGAHYPLTTPSYTLKLIVGFENNPWLSANGSSSFGFSQDRISSVASSVSGQGSLNTTYFTQMRMSKITLSQKILSRQKSVLQIENAVLDLLEKIEENRESLKLHLDTLRLQEKNLEIFELRLSEGLIRKSDFLEAITDCAEEKITVLSLHSNQELLKTQLQILTSAKKL